MNCGVLVGAAAELVVVLMAERPIGRQRQVEAAEMPVAVIAEIIDVVVVALEVPDRQRPHQEAVIVVIDLAALVVGVADIGDLRGEAGNRQVLAIEIGDEDVVLAQLLADVVEAAVGVLLQPAEIGEVVLPAVVVAVAEQAHAELAVLEQEAAEIGRERLDADAHRIEIVALGRRCGGDSRRTPPAAPGTNRRASVPCAGLTLTTPSSSTSVWLKLKAGVRLNSRSGGLKAVSPLMRSRV